MKEIRKKKKMNICSNDKIIKEIFRICKDLGIKIDTKRPSVENKYLSAWHKRMDSF